MLENVAGVREVVTEGSWLHAWADGAPRLVPTLLQTLEEAGMAVVSVTLARSYVGRRLPAAHGPYLPDGLPEVKCSHDRSLLVRCIRLLRLLWRQPWFLAINLLQPAVWLVLFGQLFHK